ncbi:hypothetical protein OAE_21585 [Vibrio cyclitrophicus 1F289]|uniref:hypothetical protein n=1 Tax=Vibrio cyclitrophicus TaxID=47951 RepID=UPI0002EDC8BB|nr:hypothetical protein [Vibrio cyclitrophicus]OEF40122.1 hypothetical protein OAE_21585 [Vibrio cyclitrophicus 1F289]
MSTFGWFWVIVGTISGLGFGYWATEEIGGLLKDVYMTGYNYVWLNELYMYFLMNGFFAMLFTGLPFYVAGIYLAAKASR